MGERGNNMQNKVLELVAENQRQKAEIERLNAMVEAAEEHFSPLPFKNAFDDYIEKAKSESLKEFAERLKAKKAIHFCKCGEPFVYTDLFNGEIDNLLEEMEREP